MKVTKKNGKKPHFFLALNCRGVVSAPAEVPFPGIEGAVTCAKLLTLGEALRQQRTFPHMEVRHRKGQLVKPAAYY